MFEEHTQVSSLYTAESSPKISSQLHESMSARLTLNSAKRAHIWWDSHLLSALLKHIIRVDPSQSYCRKKSFTLRGTFASRFTLVVYYESFLECRTLQKYTVFSIQDMIIHQPFFLTMEQSFKWYYCINLKNWLQRDKGKTTFLKFKKKKKKN